MGQIEGRCVREDLLLIVVTERIADETVVRGIESGCRGDSSEYPAADA
jgi:hypothetical protein